MLHGSYVAGFDLIHTNSYNQIVVSAASLIDFKDHGCWKLGMGISFGFIFINTCMNFTSFIRVTAL